MENKFGTNIKKIKKTKNLMENEWAFQHDGAPPHYTFG